jgi:molybdopterin-binding protein
LLGVSSDTVRRWVDAGRLSARRDDNGHRIVDGSDLAAFARTQIEAGNGSAHSSARNRFRGIVTEVIKDAVMAQVEIAAGPYRVVSLMSRQAADELGLAPGVVAAAVIKSTNVVVEIPDQSP